MGPECSTSGSQHKRRVGPLHWPYPPPASPFFFPAVRAIPMRLPPDATRRRFRSRSSTRVASVSLQRKSAVASHGRRRAPPRTLLAGISAPETGDHSVAGHMKHFATVCFSGACKDAEKLVKQGHRLSESAVESNQLLAYRRTARRLARRFACPVRRPSRRHAASSIFEPACATPGFPT